MSHPTSCLCPACSDRRAAAHRCPAPVGPLPGLPAIELPALPGTARAVTAPLPPPRPVVLTTCPRCGPKDARGPNGELLSHVTCAPCAKEQRAEWAAQREVLRREREAADNLRRATLRRERALASMEEDRPRIERELAELRARRRKGGAA